MADGITLAYSGAIAQSKALDIQANNLANSSTVGFRALQPRFDQVLRQSSAVGDGPPIVISGVAMDSRQGPVRKTDDPLDVALRGNGFLAVQTERGERYTRAGRLAIAEDGTLVTTSGEIVGSVAGTPIKMGKPQNTVLINRIGEVRVADAVVGQLKIVEFEDPSKLLADGFSLWQAPGGVEPMSEESRTEVLQGHVEDSNVNALHGLTQMVQISRAFEAFNRTIQTFQEINRKAANEIVRK